MRVGSIGLEPLPPPSQTRSAGTTVTTMGKRLTSGASYNKLQIVLRAKAADLAQQLKGAQSAKKAAVAAKRASQTALAAAKRAAEAAMVALAAAEAEELAAEHRVRRAELSLLYVGSRSSAAAWESAAEDLRAEPSSIHDRRAELSSIHADDEDVSGLE